MIHLQLELRVQDLPSMGFRWNCSLSFEILWKVYGNLYGFVMYFPQWLIFEEQLSNHFKSNHHEMDFRKEIFGRSLIHQPTYGCEISRFLEFRRKLPWFMEFQLGFFVLPKCIEKNKKRWENLARWTQGELGWGLRSLSFLETSPKVSPERMGAVHDFSHPKSVNNCAWSQNMEMNDSHSVQFQSFFGWSDIPPGSEPKVDWMVANEMGHRPGVCFSFMVGFSKFRPLVGGLVAIFYFPIYSE